MFENIPVDKIGFSNKRQSNLEYLGSDMIEGGNEFGAGTPYGKIVYLVMTKYVVFPQSQTFENK